MQSIGLTNSITRLLIKVTRCSAESAPRSLSEFFFKVQKSLLYNFINGHEKNLKPLLIMSGL